MPPEKIYISHFEKYLHAIQLKVTGYLRNTIPFYSQNPVKFRYLEFLSKIFNFRLSLTSGYFELGDDMTSL